MAQGATEWTPEAQPTGWARFKRFLIGAPRDLNDASLFHQLSLVPLPGLAWAPMASPPPPMAPRRLIAPWASTPILAIGLALAVALTVFIISAAYSHIIELFPHGGGYSGTGIHMLLNILKAFPNYYHNLVFMSVGVIDSGQFKGEAKLLALKAATERSLRHYVELASKLGLPAVYRYSIGIDVVEKAEKVCREVAREFPKTIFFAG